MKASRSPTQGDRVEVDLHLRSAARDLDHALLGAQSASEVRRTALLQLVNMGATLFEADAPLDVRYAMVNG